MTAPTASYTAQLKQSDDTFINDSIIGDTLTGMVANEKLAVMQVQTERPLLPENTQRVTIFHESKDWLAGFILLAILIAGFIKLSAGKYLNDLFSSLRFAQSANKLYSASNLQNEKPAWALNILFLITTSILIFEYAVIFRKHPEITSAIVLFLFVSGSIVLYFITKNILYHFIAFIFDSQQDTQEYLFNSNMLSKAFGLMILPIIAIVPFTDYLTASYLLKAGLALLLVMYFIQLLRGAKIILRTPLSIFYMFLYFCALEILPLSILIKVMAH